MKNKVNSNKSNGLLDSEQHSSSENLLARSTLQSCKRIVIKIGTSSLTNSQGSLNLEKVAEFTRAISNLQKTHNKEILLVTSGAIGAGVAALGFKKRPTALAHLQMAAAIGQSRLMSLYSEFFSKENILCAQVLLTHDDLKNRSRHINAVNTFEALISHKVIPIINENDVVAVNEIKVGDNDTLASMVAIMCKADLLILLTTSDGLRTSAQANAPRIPYISQVTNKTLGMAKGKTNQFSIGGMQTKLIACRNAAKVGIQSLILDSNDPDNIKQALSGVDMGTYVGIKKNTKKLQGKKRYVGFFQESKGILYLDDGAARNLQNGKSSLLAVGIAKVSGKFKGGAVVELRTLTGQEIGRGMTPFSSSDIKRIRGKRTFEIASIDDTLANKPVVHKDQLILS